MKFPLEDCIFLERLNRFVAKVLYKQKVQKAYIRNTGRLKELLVKNVKGRCLSFNSNCCELELKAVFYEGFYTFIDSALVVDLFLEYIKKDSLFKNIKTVKKEPRFENHRFDILINEKELIELKSVNLIENKVGMFPDSPSKRASSHVNLLIELYKRGLNPHLFFIINSPLGESFKPNCKEDKLFCESLKKYFDLGLDIKAFTTITTESSIEISKEVKVYL